MTHNSRLERSGSGPAAQPDRSAAMAPLNRGHGMDALQGKHERAVGDAFIDWFNNQTSTSFAYFARGAEDRKSVV